MYGIGTVARLAQVSVRTLRHYDEIGLLKPAWADPQTGYRWYSPEQLHRLHRILVLRDLGVSLTEIGTLLEADVTIEQLRGILLLREAEARERMEAETQSARARRSTPASYGGRDHGRVRSRREAGRGRASDRGE